MIFTKKVHEFLGRLLPAKFREFREKPPLL
mgnify:FL=1